MSEINNIPPQLGGKLDPIKAKQKPIEGEVAFVPEGTEEPQKREEIPAGFGVIGQSQIKRPGAVADTEFFAQNPKVVEMSEKYFDKVLAELEAKHDPEAYEKACVLQEAFTKELTA